MLVLSSVRGGSATLRLFVSQGPSGAPWQVSQKGVKQALDRPGVDQCLAKVAESLPIGHRIARSEAGEGAKTVAVGDLKARGVIGKAVEALQHEHLEHEQRSKARPAARPPGFGENGRLDAGLKESPFDQLAHAHQRRLEGRHIKGLNELIEESRVAKRNVSCHPMTYLNSSLPATSFIAQSLLS